MLPSETELQLLFAELNNVHFRGTVPACCIRYNARFSNCAGRITYRGRPLLIELSPKHLRACPAALRETLLHEMIHAWLFELYRDTGHSARFKKKMRECGLTSIYHDLDSVRPVTGSAKRYILRCDRCAMEVLRKRRPSRPASCGRCSRRGFDPRFVLAIHEIVETRPAGPALGTAARSARTATLVEAETG